MQRRLLKNKKKPSCSVTTLKNKVNNPSSPSPAPPSPALKISIHLIKKFASFATSVSCRLS